MKQVAVVVVVASLDDYLDFELNLNLNL